MFLVSAENGAGVSILTNIMYVLVEDSGWYKTTKKYFQQAGKLGLVEIVQLRGEALDDIEDYKLSCL